MDPMEDAVEEAADPDALDMGGADMDIGAAVAGGDWGDDLDLDLGGVEVPVEETTTDARKSAAVSLGESCQSKWLKARKLPCDLVAAGEFEEALQLLKRRLGVINIDPLEPLFQEAYWATCAALPSLPQAPPVHSALLAKGSAKGRSGQEPVLLFSPTYIFTRVKECMQLTTAGKFADALAAFRTVLQCIPLPAANDQKEEQQLLDMIGVCREYVNLCRIEVARK